MFKEIYAIAKHTSLRIIVAPAGEKLSLMIIPQPNGTSEKALGKPLQITGTPEELDAELPAEIARFCEATNEVRSNLGETIDALKSAASKPRKSKPVKAAAKPTVKPKRASATKKKALPKPPRPKKKAAKAAPPSKPKAPSRPAATRAAAAPAKSAAVVTPTALNPADDWPFPT